MDAIKRGDGSHRTDVNIVEMTISLESDDELIDVVVGLFVPEREAVHAGFVDHRDGGGTFGEFHEVHGVDTELAALASAARGLDEVDESGDVASAVEAG